MKLEFKDMRASLEIPGNSGLLQNISDGYNYGDNDVVWASCSVNHIVGRFNAGVEGNPNWWTIPELMNLYQHVTMNSANEIILGNLKFNEGKVSIEIPTKAGTYENMCSIRLKCDIKSDDKLYHAVATNYIFLLGRASLEEELQKMGGVDNV